MLCKLKFVSGMMGPPPGPPGGGPHNPSKSSKKKKRLADKILPQKVRELVPESQAYMDLLAFERKLDSTIMRKRLDIQVNSLNFLHISLQVSSMNDVT